jgi:glycosyltransferase involved in cell wall biosynthesis
MDVYHERSQFVAADLKRVEEQEAQWLATASRVFFGTKWALEKTVEDYGIPRSNLTVAGAGGSLAIPESDGYEGGLNFLFVALDFERKGGRICAEAFATVRKEFPEARLTIVGAAPPAEVLKQAGVTYVGLLRKSVPAELQKLIGLFKTAVALVHPTSMDIQPLVICEVAYYGCPTIAPKSFGIPELVQDGVTGFLVDMPLTPTAFAQRMLEICKDTRAYKNMRAAVMAHSAANLTWDAIGERLAGSMILRAKTGSGGVARN